MDMLGVALGAKTTWGRGGKTDEGGYYADL